MDIKCILIIVFARVTPTQAPIPGTFFWKPRTGIDLSIPTTEVNLLANRLSKENILNGRVVVIDGYQVGLTVIALATGFSDSSPYPHLNPTTAYFYTNAYRWGLRHLSLLPQWIRGHGHYCDTHKVWRRRFYYAGVFVPKWLRYLFPYVDAKEWEKERVEFRRFTKLSEPAFGRHYRYPSKVFNNYTSWETRESSDTWSSSSSN